MGRIKNGRFKKKYGRTSLRLLRRLRSVRPGIKLCKNFFIFEMEQQTSIHTFGDITARRTDGTEKGF